MPDADANFEEIIVDAFSPRYLAAYAAVARFEGGFVDDPLDRGGTTKYGVSLRFLKSEGAFDEDGDGVAEFDLDMDGDIDGQDIRRLKPIDAKYLFRRCFWDRLECERLPFPLGEAVFDQAVNGGNAAAIKLLQRTINTVWDQALPHSSAPELKVDGVIGPATRAALERLLALPAAGMHAVLLGYRQAAAARYRAIVAANTSQRRFLNGWLRRASELGKI